ncbi:MAG: hypothetical protein PHX87_04265 [Candidatus Peribacteraceae bacterium]|nr:hypothetical protein [Candidatus Peribacteraceae bacterium]MDD5742614.1 hypothetical protein [Candidatus Peribacteraceae bacterium]
MAQLTRDEKEQLYITKTIELQRLWKNPIPHREEFNFSDATEEWLDAEIRKTNALIRYEKRTEIMARVLGIGTTIFIVLGIVGLLIFGIKQLAGLFL